MEYFVEEGSHTGHCCFDWSVMVKKEDGDECVVCECFEKEDAFRIADALNASQGV